MGSESVLEPMYVFVITSKNSMDSKSFTGFRIWAQYEFVVNSRKNMSSRSGPVLVEILQFLDRFRFRISFMAGMNWELVLGLMWVGDLFQDS